MAKLITRDEWRVVVTGTLDLSVPDGPRLQVRIKDAVIPPQRLGDFGWVSMSDSRVSSDIEGDYQRRCEEIVRALRSQHPGVKAEVMSTTTETCSHCGLVWEEWTTESAARWPAEDYVFGEPLCCDKAQDEWRAARAGVA
ncbi:hypothetical protein ACFC26_09505 [Kitasatospora purpeofusca]|uniref:hypothetical protein n=1 Tax=Kitasatospora purpeofusca TaxID=67352 RepID=UPI0035D9AD35